MRLSLMRPTSKESIIEELLLRLIISQIIFMDKQNVPPKPEIRTLKNGGWYWLNRTVLIHHGRKLKPSGIAVYNVLASFANAKQSCFPTQKTIADVVGVSRRTVMRKIRELNRLGIIRTEKRKGACGYVLLDTCQVTNGIQGCDKSDIAPVTPGTTNDNKITIINNDNDRVEFKKSFESDFEGFSPKSKVDLLALDVAAALQDTENLPYYLSVSRKCPEDIIRKILGEVKEVPEERIKKSRGALFNHLIQTYAQKNSNHSGD